MSDTRRTKAEILALLADNSIGAISAQDLRDAIVTMMGGFGSIRNSNSSTAFTVTATPTKLTTFTDNGFSNGLTVDHTTDTITIDVAGVYYIDFSISFSGTALKTFAFSLYDSSGARFRGIDRKLGTGGDVGSAAFGTILSIAAGEVMSIRVWSTDGGTSITPVDADLTIHQIA